MQAFRPTFDFAAYRITAVDVVEEEDNLVKISVNAAQIRHPAKTKTLPFFEGYGGRAVHSLRFHALLRSLPVTEIDDTEEMVGRVFAMKNGGGKPDDFASLEYAAACIQCDIARFKDGAAYAQKCAMEEILNAA